MTLVIDASVAFKWFVREEGSDAARALLALPEPLVAPELLAAELLNTAWKVWRRGQLPAAQMTAIAAQLENERWGVDLWSHGLLAARAAAWCQALDHPVYDCLYLALAELLAAPLVTADARLVRLAAGTDLAPLVRPLEPFAG